MTNTMKLLKKCSYIIKYIKSKMAATLGTKNLFRYEIIWYAILNVALIVPKQTVITSYVYL